MSENKPSLGTLKKGQCALMIIDVQERLVPPVDRSDELVRSIKNVIRGCQSFGIPIVVTEQYPDGLGRTVPELREIMDDDQVYLPKLSFSALGDEAIRDLVKKMPETQWILVGIEAHVCVLQTARDLIEAAKQVVVLNDAITSRSIYDFSTAISELKSCGVRISSSEIVLFELLESAKAPEFKEIQALVK